MPHIHIQVSWSYTASDTIHPGHHNLRRDRQSHSPPEVRAEGIKTSVNAASEKLDAQTNFRRMHCHAMRSHATKPRADVIAVDKTRVEETETNSVGPEINRGRRCMW